MSWLEISSLRTDQKEDQKVQTSLDPVLKWEKKEILHRFQISNNPYTPIDMNQTLRTGRKADPLYASCVDIHQGKSRDELLKGKAARSLSSLI